jgi:hypothetical protein
MTRSSSRSWLPGVCAVATALAWLAVAGSALASGGNTCNGAPWLTGTASGTTAGASDKVATVSLGCNGTYTSVAGPDVFYEIAVGPGNDFTITVTPAAGYDTSIYVTSSECTGSTCGTGWGADVAPAGGAESLHLSALPTGHYFLGIDSFYPSTDARSSGNYTVAISGTVGAVPVPATRGWHVALLALGLMIAAWLPRRSRALA